ncbi:MAG: DUF4416 family protein [Candidatus Omnitrophota bacterium]
MAQVIGAVPVKFIIGVLFSAEDVLPQVKVYLQKRFGPFDFQSAVLPFNYTAYYDDQMGPDLRRQFLSVERLIEPKRLADIKLYTNKLEAKLSRKRGAVRQNKVFPRRINLDPGYICAAKLVLATCKDYSHRIYLGKGIYAEVTLQYRGNSFAPQEWTYPDYRSKEYLEIFKAVRALYMKQLSLFRQ